MLGRAAVATAVEIVTGSVVSVTYFPESCPYKAFAFASENPICCRILTTIPISIRLVMLNTAVPAMMGHAVCKTLPISSRFDSS